MDLLHRLYGTAVEMYRPLGLGLMAALVVLLAIQLHYYLGLFRRLPSFRMDGPKNTDDDPKNARDGRTADGERTPAGAISVVVVMGDDYPWIENTLPLLMAQDHPAFEVVAVCVGGDREFVERLEEISLGEPRLRVSRIRQHPLFPISNKMALNIGIKAARHENIVVTTPFARPASVRWLSLMARGFSKGETVVAYCGMEPSKGLMDKVIRSARMFSSLLYLTAAIKGRPYRGTIHNLGFTREIYFRHKGFNHLSLNLGEDDLFMQKLFTPGNFSIVMHPRATVRQMRWGGLWWWLGECRLRNHTFPLYPARARRFVTTEAASRLLFFAVAAATAALMPFEVRIGVAALVVLRYTAVVLQMRRVARRLGERGLVGFYFINDLLEPLFEIGVVVSRVVKPIREIWR